MSREVVISTLAERARIDTHAKSFIGPNGKIQYQPRKGEITQEDIANHLKDGPYLGVYFVAPGESTCKIAALDLDDKKGECGPEGMRNTAFALYNSLGDRGLRPTLERSGSGKGYHIWMMFREPQQAGRVRSFLTNILEEAGYEEGTGGVSKKQIEIFPRQAHVKEGEYGNLMALPYNRKSALLTSKFDDVHESVLSRFPEKICQGVPELPNKEKKQKKEKKARKTSEKEVRLDLQEVSACLEHVVNDDLDYDDWLHIIYAVHDATDGSSDGYEIALKWSQSSDKHDQKEFDNAWSHTKDRGDGGVTWKTLAKMARENGWVRFKNLIQDIVYVVGQDQYASIESDWMLSDGPLDKKFAHLMKDVSKYLVASDQLLKPEELTFYPGQPRVITDKGRLCLNRWMDPRLQSRAGSPAPFLEHMERLIPNDMERNHVLDFLAFLVQRPGEKILHVPVIQGVQGCGKSFLGTAMRPILGSKYVKELPNSALKSEFNGYMANVTLLLVEELMVRNRIEMLNNLKTSITEEEVHINEKHVKGYYTPNRVNFLAFTNHKDSLILEPGDRRYFVVFSPLEPAALPRGYFERLWSWTAEHPGILKGYLESRDLANFSHKDPPPMTDAKQELLQLSKSNNQLVVEAIIKNEAAHPMMTRDVVDVQTIKVAARSNNEFIEDRDIVRVLSSMGCRRVGDTVWVVRNHEIWEKKDQAACMEEYRRKVTIPGGSNVQAFSDVIAF